MQRVQLAATGRHEAALGGLFLHAVQALELRVEVVDLHAAPAVPRLLGPQLSGTVQDARNGFSLCTDTRHAQWARGRTHGHEALSVSAVHAVCATSFNALLSALSFSQASLARLRSRARRCWWNELRMARRWSLCHTQRLGRPQSLLPASRPSRSARQLMLFFFAP